MTGLFSGSSSQRRSNIIVQKEPQTSSCLKQVQLQQQDKTGFRLDLENAVRVKRLQSFWPSLMREYTSYVGFADI